MGKNIVICSDGTGNTTIKGRGTNVFRLFESVDVNGHRTTPGLTPQIAFYDDGVGTGGIKLARLLGGAFGWGLSRNVKQLYADLARCYEPGDRIYMFGFSRGAFTVRTLAGFINACGLPKAPTLTERELRRAVNEAYALYRARYGRQPDTEARQLEYRRRYAISDAQHAPDGIVPIEFLGVWDTVDAVGLPFHLADLINATIYRFKFKDRFLCPNVRRACHALAIDEERQSFEPVLWDESKEETGSGGRVRQVWFAGVHSNVGGGYAKHGMSLATLNWMMQHAAEAGLRFIDADREFVRDHANVNDKLYDSRSGAGALYRYLPRDIASICDDHRVTPAIHVTALERIAQATDGYAPGNLPLSAKVIQTDGKVIQQVRLRDLDPASKRRSPLGPLRRRVAMRRFCSYGAPLSLFSTVVLASVWSRNASDPRPGWGALGTILLAILFAVTGSVVRTTMLDSLSTYWHERRLGLRRQLGVRGTWAAGAGREPGPETPAAEALPAASAS